VRATCPAHLFLLCLVCLIIWKLKTDILFMNEPHILLQTNVERVS
jgi:hypothetical protein